MLGERRGRQDAFQDRSPEVIEIVRSERLGDFELTTRGLTEEQLDGLACVWCGLRGGCMVPMAFAGRLV